MFLDDIVKILTDAGIPTASIFVSSKAVIPVGAGPYISVTETGGSGPEGTHNSTVLPAYVRPNAQILVRATSYPTARTTADTAWNALFAVKNQLVNGVFWRQVIMLQEPFDFGVDANGRATVVFNIAVTKRKNAATS